MRYKIKYKEFATRHTECDNCGVFDRIKVRLELNPVVLSATPWDVNVSARSETGITELCEKCTKKLVADLRLKCAVAKTKGRGKHGNKKV